jgi:hypothetical protein
MQNDWVLLDENLITDKTNTITRSLEKLKTFLYDAYELRGSENTQKIWNGFRAIKSSRIKTFKICTTSWILSHLS